MEYVSTGEQVSTGWAEDDAAGNFLSGHGTRTVIEDAEDVDNVILLSTVSGVVERVNKLISVRPSNLRYFAEVGEVIIGRVVSVGDNRWNLDIGGPRHATLMISSVSIPGTVQKRLTEEDNLEMRTMFQENDLISAEIFQVKPDNRVKLHIRSSRFGKLKNGVLVIVEQVLVKRMMNHFITLKCGVSLILSSNGYIWAYIDGASKPSEQQFREVATIRNIIQVLNKAYYAINPENVEVVYQVFKQLEISIPQIVSKEYMIDLIRNCEE